MRPRTRRVIVVALAGVTALAGFAGVAWGGTVTTPTGNPFVVPGNASGNPVAFTVVATGYVPGSLVSVEQCDGVATTDPHWSPTTDCDLGTSPSPAITDGTGKVTFSSTNPNFAFTPFKGQSPQGLFNCLSPNGPALKPSDGLPDYRNCKIRVSTNNSAITADQGFLNIQLPEAVAGTTTTKSSTTTTVRATTTTTTMPSTVFAISTTSLPRATLGGVYSVALSAVHGTPPLKWKRVGKLPKGLKLNAATGVIAGVPKKTTGTFTFTIIVSYKTKVKGHPVVHHTASEVLSITVT